MDIDFNNVNPTEYLADLVQCENTSYCIEQLLLSDNAKETVNSNLYPLGNRIMNAKTLS